MPAEKILGKSWADDDNSEFAPLPETTETEPDSNGIKTVISWRRNEEGIKVKTIRTVRVTKKVERVNKNVYMRKQWKKFGESAGKGRGAEQGITMVSNEEIVLELSKPRQGASQSADESKDITGKAIITCRICGKTGDHWTLQCPFKGTKMAAMATAEKPPVEEASGSRLEALGSRTKEGAYVPPNRRLGGSSGTAPPADTAGPGGRFKEEFATVRVTNLSEEATEADLQGLFKQFGNIARIYIAKDKNTGDNRGFAFVNFYNKEDAAKAIAGLNGKGFNHLILQLEYAKPSQSRYDPNAAAGGNAPSSDMFPSRGGRDEKPAFYRPVGM